MQLRPYEDSDLDQLIVAWRAASVVAHPFLTPDFLEEEVSNIKDVYLPVTENWVAVEGEEIVGFLSLLGEEVGAIFVHPSYWGQGAGRALMDKAVELRGSLTLDVFEENKTGRAFYDKYGFRVTGRSIHKQTGLPILHMALGTPSRTKPGDQARSEAE